jgi:ABC-type branched-subunit amino acid transport system ATPase component/branched-subunit amino acid ABC-type transport system permease component
VHLTIQLFLAGLTVGSAYGLAAMGLVVVYKGSGVLNFAQGGIGMIGTYVFAYLQRDGFGMWPSVVVGMISSAALSAVTYLVVIRPLRNASMLSKVIATLGLLLFLEDVAIIAFGSKNTTAPSPLPITFFHQFGYDFPIGGLELLGVVIVLTAGLSLYYRKTVTGLATEAVSLSEPSTLRLGYFVNRLALGNWAIGGALAAAAGILVVNSTGLSQDVLTSIVITVMGAAVLGGFRSLWLTLLAALFIGVLSSELVSRVTTPGVTDVIPFALIVVALLFRGDVLPSRASLDGQARLPAVPTARFRPGSSAIFIIAVVAAGLILNNYWRLQVAQGLALGIIGMSIVLLTGYVGQVSLAQWAFAGVGGLFGVSLAENHGLPLLAVLAISAATGFGLGMVTGLSAIRIRGIALAVVTLVAGNAIQGLWFVRVYDLNAVEAPLPSLFGLKLQAEGQYFFDAILLGLVAAAVWYVRRRMLGRRMLAVRASERAAAASGMWVTEYKLLVFGAAAGLAAIGGALYGYGVGSGIGDDYGSFQSILLLGVVYLNGVGSLAGGLGAIGIVVGPAILTQFHINGNWFGVFVGASLVFNLVRFPDGVAVHQAVYRDAKLAALKARWNARSGKAQPAAVAELVVAANQPTSPELTPANGNQPVAAASAVMAEPAPDGGRVDNESKSATPLLVADDVVVRYGSFVAVSHVNLHVDRGELVGLIGPNGAGKTSLFDAMCGFVRTSSGSVGLAGKLLNRKPPHRRAALGLRRTFQSAELFDDLTVHDNIAVCATSSESAAAVIERLGLNAYASTLARAVPAGVRRRVDLGRTLAAGPSVVLLDEVGAGLGAQDKEELTSFLRRVAAMDGIAFVLVDHDVDLVATACERAYVLALGQVISEGPISSVLQDPAVIESYLGRGALVT